MKAPRGSSIDSTKSSVFGCRRRIQSFLFAEKCCSKLCLSIYQNFSLSHKKVAFNVNFPANPKKRYPDCIKITPIGRRNGSNFTMNLQIKSENSYLAKIDTVNENSSPNLEDDYNNCLAGYITVSNISMHIIKERSFWELKKVQF